MKSVDGASAYTAISIATTICAMEVEFNSAKFFSILTLMSSKTITSFCDIRWRQRFNNYKNALLQLDDAVELAWERPLSNLEKQGLIQAFEFTHELAWNVIKDYFVYQGNTNITGSRDASREAFEKGLIEDGEGWMEMIISRNQSSHTYNQVTADKIAERIIENYLPLFIQFKTKMDSLISSSNE